MKINQTNLSQLLTSINHASSEEDVQKKIIVPLLLLLGYTSKDWREQVIIGQVRLDYSIHPLGWINFPSPYLVIEVKSPRSKIKYTPWQIHQYLRTSGGVLGLLTNGYQFKIIYNFQGHIETILEYSQEELTENYQPFEMLLCKKMGVCVHQAFYNSHGRIHHKFIEFIAKKTENTPLHFLGNDAKNLDGGIGIPTKLMGRNLPELSSDKLQLIRNFQEVKPMIITVFNNKGGVGKTTLTINMAAALSKLGYKILLIDIDGQANLTTGLGIDPLGHEELGKKDITHLLTEPLTKIEDVILKKRWHDVALHIIPSHIRLSYMENQLNTTIDIDRVLENKLRNHPYDFVFIDPPPAFGRVNNISLMASSGVIIPTQLSAYPIRALEYVLDRVKEIQQIKPLSILGVVVSMYDQKSSNFNLSMKENMIKMLQRKGWEEKISLFPEETWIPRLNVISIAQQREYPIYEAEFDNISYQDREAGGKAVERYTTLAQHLIKICQGELKANE